MSQKRREEKRRKKKKEGRRRKEDGEICFENRLRPRLKRVLTDTN